MKTSHASEDARLFQAVIKAFAVAAEEDAINWPGLFMEFDTAFKRSRIERAAYTPYLNILEVFGIRLRELRHSQVIKWFLDENAGHEQGALFANALMAHLGWAEENVVDYRVSSEWPERVDISAFKKGCFAVFIENKVRHHERIEQIADLIKALVILGSRERIPINKRFAVFLTDDGRKPLTAPSEMPEGFNEANLWPLDRRTVFTLFLSALESKNESGRSPLLMALLTNYIHAIATHPGAK